MPASQEARSLADLDAEVRATDMLCRAGDLISVGRRLPALIDELHVHANLASAKNPSTRALSILIESYIAASFLAKSLGYLDLSRVAATKADHAARVLADPVSIGKAAFLRFHAGGREINSWERAFTLAERSARRLEPQANDAQATGVLGLLELSAALAAAVLARRTMADQWLTRAEALAARVSPQMAGNWQSFCSANVAIWRIAIAVESGDNGQQVAGLAQMVDQSEVTSAARYAAFLIDLSRGLARDENSRGDAIDWLRRAEIAAPQLVRNSATARETIGYLLARATASAGGELQGMASRLACA